MIGNEIWDFEVLSFDSAAVKFECVLIMTRTVTYAGYVLNERIL